MVLQETLASNTLLKVSNVFRVFSNILSTVQNVFMLCFLTVSQVNQQQDSQYYHIALLFTMHCRSLSHQKQRSQFSFSLPFSFKFLLVCHGCPLFFFVLSFLWSLLVFGCLCFIQFLNHDVWQYHHSRLQWNLSSGTIWIVLKWLFTTFLFLLWFSGQVAILVSGCDVNFVWIFESILSNGWWCPDTWLFHKSNYVYPNACYFECCQLSSLEMIIVNIHCQDRFARNGALQHFGCDLDCWS